MLVFTLHTNGGLNCDLRDEVDLVFMPREYIGTRGTSVYGGAIEEQVGRMFSTPGNFHTWRALTPEGELYTRMNWPEGARETNEHGYPLQS